MSSLWAALGVISFVVVAALGLLVRVSYRAGQNDGRINDLEEKVERLQSLVEQGRTWRYQPRR